LHTVRELAHDDQTPRAALQPRLYVFSHPNVPYLPCGRACQARACRRRHAPLWSARQAALWHAGEQYRAMLQPEHSCRRRPASLAPDRLRHLRVRNALVNQSSANIRQGVSTDACVQAARAARAARTPATSSPRGAARAPAGAGPPGWAPTGSPRRWPHSARRRAQCRSALAGPRLPTVAPPLRWPPGPRHQPVQAAEASSLRLKHMRWAPAARC
jgi:hypothetical protein